MPVTNDILLFRSSATWTWKGRTWNENVWTV